MTFKCNVVRLMCVDFIIWNYVAFNANTIIYLLSITIYFGLMLIKKMFACVCVCVCIYIYI